MSKERAHGIKDYPTLLGEIRKRPQVFLGGAERSVVLLSAFIGGIKYGEYFHSVPDHKKLGGFSWDSFENWVEEMFNPRRLTLDSMSLAAHLTSNDQEGFDLWFLWLDAFRGL
ncbi:hypothetical protein [Litoribrevibacter albus]|uniref:Uncharacterized protein n=1 Tax=Litoribrevibacter albus TaxID=1473156 RepID=A0AA37SBF7_9GAMM|nr:hypothetical protein [Litoribrevibacter albus]GLQ31356.1 hypothetical protein GCM10007876_18350 [Litoribrevibacter albus]